MAHVAKGTSFTWNNVVIAELTNVGGLETTVDEIDDTTHQSPNDYKQSSPGMLAAGDISLAGFFVNTDTTGQHAMLADMNSRTKRASVITFPAATGATWTIPSSYVKSLKFGDADLSGNIPFTATIKVDGKPVFAVAAVTGMSACGFSNDVLMMPTFDIAKFEYVVTITNAQTSTIITPVDATGGEIITIVSGGVSQTVGTGNPSSAIPVSSSAMTDIDVVISAANKASKTYKFHCAVLAA